MKRTRAISWAEKIALHLPVLTASEANTREHWTARNRRKKAQQLATRCHLSVCACKLRPLGQPARVHLVRLGTRKLDSDNLAGSFKHIRDAIAAWFGFDDGDERTEWTYAQRVVPRADVGSEIILTFEGEA